MIRLHPPDSKVCYCPVTAAYRVKYGTRVRLGDALGVGFRRLGLNICTGTAINYHVGNVLIYGADLRERTIRERYPVGGVRCIRARRTLFRICDVDLSKL